MKKLKMLDLRFDQIPNSIDFVHPEIADFCSS